MKYWRILILRSQARPPNLNSPPNFLDIRYIYSHYIQVPYFTVVPKFMHLPPQCAPKCKYWATVLQQYLNLGSSQHHRWILLWYLRHLVASYIDNFAFIWTKIYCLYVFDNHDYLNINILSSVVHLYLMLTIYSVEAVILSCLDI